MQGNRWLRFNVFVSDLNYPECQEPQNCILEVSMQLTNFSELQIGRNIYLLRFQAMQKVLFSFLESGTLINMWRNKKFHKNYFPWAC